MNSNLATRPRRLVTAALTATLAVTLAACSSPSATGGTGKRTTAPRSAPATRSAGAPKATSPLSGKWSGRYSGSYNGTFTLRWHQSGTHLHGTIHISSAPGTLPINGRVNGSAIRFGTVGSTAITYTGTVSGSSMSGTYQVHATSGSTGGPPHASKSSPSV